MNVTPLWDAVTMLIEAALRAQSAAKEMLALIDDGSASCEELRDALPTPKSTAAMIAAAQRSAAASIAGRERHGDDGAEVLATAAGLSRQEARSHIKTAQTLRDLPAVRDAVESGLVSHANAKQLAAAVEKAGSSAVASDSELLAKAGSLRPEQFAREARRWVTSQDRDDGAAEHARQRARRKLRVWNGDDGMTRLYGEFDTITGTRIANRLRACASDMHTADKNNASDNNTKHGGTRWQRRSFDQCMADALDTLTNNDRNTGGGKPIADICVVAHIDEATGKLIAELPDRTKLPDAVLEELACNARLTGVIYDRKGKAIWRAESVRCATDAQRQLLIARDGGCFGCDAHPGVCDAHHVRPVSQGGPTKIDNLVLACWRCHHKIHHLGWQIHGPPAHRTLHPPKHPHLRTRTRPRPTRPAQPQRQPRRSRPVQSGARPPTSQRASTMTTYRASQGRGRALPAVGVARSRGLVVSVRRGGEGNRTPCDSGYSRSQPPGHPHPRSPQKDFDGEPEACPPALPCPYDDWAGCAGRGSSRRVLAA